MGKDESRKGPEVCSRCSRVCGDDARRHLGALLCEDCYMDALTRPKRKTHWQYIFSVKSEYLLED